MLAATQGACPSQREAMKAIPSPGRMAPLQVLRRTVRQGINSAGGERGKFGSAGTNGSQHRGQITEQHRSGQKPQVRQAGNIWRDIPQGAPPGIVPMPHDGSVRRPQSMTVAATAPVACAASARSLVAAQRRPAAAKDRRTFDA